MLEAMGCVDLPKNLTISISDELAKEMDTMPEINWSEVCRQAISKYIDEKKFKEKGELITGLEEYLKAKLSTPEAVETLRKIETERFTRKWGEPEIVKTENAFIAQSPYIRLRKIQPIKIGNTILTTLKIFNDIVWKANITPDRLLEFDTKKWKNIAQGNLDHIVDYFKSKGFTVGEYQRLTPYMVADFVTDGDVKAAEEISTEFVPGLFALDKEDIVFIAYRKTKFSKTISSPDGWRLTEIE